MLPQKKILATGGFTLMELIIVVAIIAVLISVAIPTFVGAVAGAQEGACTANGRSLQGALTISHAVGDPLTFNGNQVVLTEAQIAQFICPAGGSFTATLNNATDAIEVRCSKHDLSTGVQAMAALAAGMNTPDSTLHAWLLAKGATLSDGSSYDYPLPIGSFAGSSQALVDTAKELGIDITSGSWRLYRWHDNDFSLYYTADNVLTCTTGAPIDIYRWSITNDVLTGPLVGTGKVVSKTAGGVTFNIIDCTKKSALHQPE